MVDLRRMEYFVAVAEELHFGRAARRLRISQPPLSTQIQRLEDELGVLLLERTKRSVALTAAGAVFLDEARDTLRRVGQAAERARRAARGDLGKIAIGVIESALYSVAPPVIRHFCARFPEVEISVTESRISTQLADLAEGKLDVGFVHPQAPHPELAEEPLLTEPLLAVVPDSHPLAARRELSLADLCAQPLIMIPREVNPPLHDQFIARCHRLALAPAISREAWPKQTVVALVAAGLGLSVLPACMKRLGHPEVVYRPITDSGIDVTTSLVWRKADTAPTTSAFLDSAREVTGR
ncbi:LysR family transcriptional regulator [Actinokineospora iranica]|uniref:DNA-binding transcriptional regulator, LysR family n=1 Tax=Actinokineospora iranica TaxID=1271860 RepID=A0A1G6VB77_9PSEU|nr:LysR family transcriptional regulator [Actinokineospora iranica]SDD50287.1 DNA-binding transcriptional regulator, LysR family [Actinokineospora iranica]